MLGRECTACSHPRRVVVQLPNASLTGVSGDWPQVATFLKRAPPFLPIRNLPIRRHLPHVCVRSICRCENVFTSTQHVWSRRHLSSMYIIPSKACACYSRDTRPDLVDALEAVIVFERSLPILGLPNHNAIGDVTFSRSDVYERVVECMWSSRTLGRDRCGV